MPRKKQQNKQTKTNTQKKSDNKTPEKSKRKPTWEKMLQNLAVWT